MTPVASTIGPTPDETAAAPLDLMLTPLIIAGLSKKRGHLTALPGSQSSLTLGRRSIVKGVPPPSGADVRGCGLATTRAASAGRASGSWSQTRLHTEVGDARARLQVPLFFQTEPLLMSRSSEIPHHIIARMELSSGSTRAQRLEAIDQFREWGRAAGRPEVAVLADWGLTFEHTLPSAVAVPEALGLAIRLQRVAREHDLSQVTVCAQRLTAEISAQIDPTGVGGEAVRACLREVAAADRDRCRACATRSLAHVELSLGRYRPAREALYKLATFPATDEDLDGRTRAAARDSLARAALDASAGAWRAAARASADGLAFAGRVANTEHLRSRLLAHQAVAYAQCGDIEPARQSASSGLGALRSTPDPPSIDALLDLARAHSDLGDLNTAEALANEAIACLAGKEWLFVEFRAHMTRCQVLAAAGCLTAAAMEAARRAAGALRDPSAQLRALDSLV